MDKIKIEKEAYVFDEKEKEMLIVCLEFAACHINISKVTKFANYAIDVFGGC